MTTIRIIKYGKYWRLINSNGYWYPQKFNYREQAKRYAYNIKR